MNSKDTNRLERRRASIDGARPVKNSGRGPEKGDAKTDDWLIDYKFNNSTFTLSATAWQKMVKDAWKEGQRDPVIVVKLNGLEPIAIIDFELLKEYYNDYQFE